MADTGNGSREAWVDRRKAKYMAQLLEAFEETIEPLLTKEQAHTFKALVRRKFNALAADFIELLNLEDSATKNELAEHLVTVLFPDGPPPQLGKGLGG
jgi:small-conductance mechanosensitive channel